MTTGVSDRVLWNSWVICFSRFVHPVATTTIRFLCVLSFALLFAIKNHVKFIFTNMRLLD